MMYSSSFLVNGPVSFIECQNTGRVFQENFGKFDGTGPMCFERVDPTAYKDKQNINISVLDMIIFCNKYVSDRQNIF